MHGSCIRTFDVNSKRVRHFRTLIKIYKPVRHPQNPRTSSHNAGREMSGIRWCSVPCFVKKILSFGVTMRIMRKKCLINAVWSALFYNFLMRWNGLAAVRDGHVCAWGCGSKQSKYLKQSLSEYWFILSKHWYLSTCFWSSLSRTLAATAQRMGFGHTLQRYFFSISIHGDIWKMMCSRSAHIPQADPQKLLRLAIWLLANSLVAMRSLTSRSGVHSLLPHCFDSLIHQNLLHAQRSLRIIVQFCRM